MQTRSMRVRDDCSRQPELRAELFAVADALNVFVTASPDVLAAVCHAIDVQPTRLHALFMTGCEIRSNLARGSPAEHSYYEM